MNGTEIISFLSSNFPTVMTAVGAITGSLFTAIFLRHNTALTEFEKIKSGQFKEVAEELLETGKMTYTEYYKAKNFLQVAKKADEYCSQNPLENVKKTYDFDWFVRFYEAVGNVSDKKMQDLWAKILAGEISRPTSYSLKTIDVLRNISKSDAELFAKVCACSFVIDENRAFLPNDKIFLKKHNIEYIDIMKLSEYGLIFNDGTITLNFTINKVPKLIFSNRNLIMTISSSSDKEEMASIPQYPFTNVGKELFSVVSEGASDKEFIEFGKRISEMKSYKIGIHNVIKREDDSVQYEINNLLDIKVREK